MAWHGTAYHQDRRTAREFTDGMDSLRTAVKRERGDKKFRFNALHRPELGWVDDGHEIPCVSAQGEI